jgi:hypothetical protein
MKIKVAIASFAVAAVVVAAFAFKAPQAPAKKFVGQWFVYTGSQSTGVYASLADAQNRSNYAFSSTTPSTSGNDYLGAIFVDASEIDDNDTPSDMSDDKPMVDISSTNIHNLLTSARNTSTGKWSDLASGNAIVEAKVQP